MTLAEQLAELRNNILRDRSDLIAGDTDSLWSDETLLSYIKDAERRFARRSYIMRDSTTALVTQITLEENVKTYQLHSSVLSVLSARFDADEFDLRRSGHALILDSVPPEFLSFDPSVPYVLPPARPIAYYTDETLVFDSQNSVTLSVYPAPSAVEAGKLINMRVVRMPMTTYTADDLLRESEIPEDYQLDVLEWAAYRAQRHFDGDAGAPVIAEAHKTAFEESIQRAIKEMKRKIHANTGLRYGGNGFTWLR